MELVAVLIAILVGVILLLGWMIGFGLMQRKLLKQILEKPAAILSTDKIQALMEHRYKFDESSFEALKELSSALKELEIPEIKVPQIEVPQAHVEISELRLAREVSELDIEDPARFSMFRREIIIGKDRYKLYGFQDFGLEKTTLFLEFEDGRLIYVSEV